MIKLTKLNEVFMHLETNKGIAREISDRFCFKIPGYQFMPKYKSGFWDGNIRMFDYKNNQMHIGLLPDLIDFCAENEYDIQNVDKIITKRNISTEKIEKFIEHLNIPEKIKPRDYQIKAVVDAINERRAGFLSPTSSGKSLIIYIITQFMIQQDKEVLIIVPTTQLVSQMDSDFAEYNNGKYLDTHCIMAGVDKKIQKPVTISTWQSIYKLGPEWFKRFDCVIGDEVHTFQANSLKGIMEKCLHTGDRFGFTGTLNGSSVHEMQIRALFGKFRVVTTTKKLMEDGHVSKLKIKAFILKYSEEECKTVKALKSYNDEIKYINSHEKRNNFIVNLVKNLKGNTLLLFKMVDTHGVIVYNKLVKALDPEKYSIHFVAGKVAADSREKIRKLVDSVKDKIVIIVGSLGTMSTGTNMKNLQNILFSAPTKAKIKVLQSIGRGLRLDGLTNEVTLYDIVDDFRIKSFVNYTLKHFIERTKTYDEQQFNYKIYNYKI